MDFLSENNIEMHKSYLNGLMLNYNIFEKSYPELVSLDIAGIYKTRIKYSEKEKAAALLSEIIAHKIYFSSFSRQNLVSERITKEFGSIAEFLYEISEACSKVKTGFLLIYDLHGRVGLYCGDEYQKVLGEKNVILALDLCEHAYFYDYGFERKKYVMNAISHFDLRKLQNV